MYYESWLSHMAGSCRILKAWILAVFDLVWEMKCRGWVPYRVQVFLSQDLCSGLFDEIRPLAVHGVA